MLVRGIAQARWPCHCASIPDCWRFARLYRGKAQSCGADGVLATSLCLLLERCCLYICMRLMQLVQCVVSDVGELGSVSPGVESGSFLLCVRSGWSLMRADAGNNVGGNRRTSVTLNLLSDVMCYLICMHAWMDFML